MAAQLTLAQMEQLADQAARQHNLPRALVLAVARHESAFRPDARRGEPHLNDASHGLMQLLLSTARGLGYTGPVGAWNDATRTGTGLYDPAVNLALGARFLRGLLNATNGDIARTLSAYNAGLGNATKARIERRFCEVWKPSAPQVGRSLDRDCARIRIVRVGEYPNQPYVDAVTRHLVSYGGSLTMPAVYQEAGGLREAGPAGGSPSGSRTPPSSPAAPTQTNFVVRTSVAVLLAAATAIAYIWQSFRGSR